MVILVLPVSRFQERNLRGHAVQMPGGLTFDSGCDKKSYFRKKPTPLLITSSFGATKLLTGVKEKN